MVLKAIAIYIALVALIVLLFLGGKAVAGEPSRDVVIVHGYTDRLGDAGEWQRVYGVLRDRLEADGYQVHALFLPTNDMWEGATFVCNYLAANNLNDVAIIGHSQGGPIARYCIKFLALERVSFYASIDSPETGLTGIECWFSRNWLNPQLCRDSDFMRALNAGDPTPDGPYWLSMTLDWPALPGACHRDIPGRFGVSAHYAAPGRADVYAWIKQGMTTAGVCAPAATATPQPTATATPTPTPSPTPSANPQATPAPAPRCSWWDRLLGRCN